MANKLAFLSEFVHVINFQNKTQVKTLLPMAARPDRLLDRLKAVRSKKPNKTCFDCGQRGPTSVNCTHSTFICTRCSGIHREYSHRIKMISMGTFTEAEVSKFEEIGNEVAENTWLAKWRPDKHGSRPDPNDDKAIRAWIQKVYIDKVFYSSKGKRKKKTKKATPEDAVTRCVVFSSLPKPFRATQNQLYLCRVATNTSINGCHPQCGRVDEFNNSKCSSFLFFFPLCSRQEKEKVSPSCHFKRFL
jgi:hypothetical protein